MAVAASEATSGDAAQRGSVVLAAENLPELFSRLHALLRLSMDRFEFLDRCVGFLEHLVFAVPDAPGGVASLLGAEQIAELNRVYCAWETALEQRFVRDVERGAANIAEYPLFERFQRLLMRELDMAGPLSDQPVLFIGSGPFPISAICIHSLTGRDVDCVDSNPEAVEQSRRLLDAIGLSKQIQVRQACGERFDSRSYSHVFVALLAKPKEAILRKIAQNCLPGSRLVCRTSTGLRQLLYEPTQLSDETLALYQRGGERLATGCIDDTISSLLLVRGAGDAAR